MIYDHFEGMCPICGPRCHYLPSAPAERLQELAWKLDTAIELRRMEWIDDEAYHRIRDDVVRQLRGEIYDGGKSDSDASVTEGGSPQGCQASSLADVSEGSEGDGEG